MGSGRVCLVHMHVGAYYIALENILCGPGPVASQQLTLHRRKVGPPLGASVVVVSVWFKDPRAGVNSTLSVLTGCVSLYGREMCGIL